MAYSTLDNLTSYGNASDLTNLFAMPNMDFPIFFPMILFAIFMILGLSTFFKQRAEEGKGDILSSLAVSGFGTIVISLAMRLLGMISKTTMITSFAICLVFIVLYLLTKKDY
jgi:putative exporter of polyketide antibiotics